MISNTLTEAVIEAAKEHKTHMWVAHGERDCEPSLRVTMREGGAGIVAVPDIGSGAADTIYATLRATISKRFPNDRVEDVVAVLDGYRLGSEDIDPPTKEALQAGHTLGHCFQTIPGTCVGEAVTIAIVADDLVGSVDWHVVSLPYAVSDGGEMVWGARVDSGGTGEHVDSAVIGAMVAFIKDHNNG